MAWAYPRRHPVARLDGAFSRRLIAGRFKAHFIAQ